MTPKRLVGLLGALLLSLALGFVPVLLSGVQGTTGLSAHWLDLVRDGTWLELDDIAIRLQLGMESGALILREVPRLLPSIALCALGLCFGAMGGFLIWIASEEGLFNDWITTVGALAGLGVGIALFGFGTRTTVHEVRPGQLSSSYQACFGLVHWQTDREVTGTAEWRVTEECTDVEDEVVCFRWVFIEVRTEDGWIRVARLPHTMGGRPEYDAAQEQTASHLVKGIQAVLSKEAS